MDQGCKNCVKSEKWKRQDSMKDEYKDLKDITHPSLTLYINVNKKNIHKNLFLKK